MTAFAFKYALIALAVLLVIGGVWWSAKHPNRSRQYPGRLRMPFFVLIVGGVLVSVGFLMALVGFTAPDTLEILPLRIAAIVILAGGLGLLLIYRNWYVVAKADEVHFRTIFGRERVIAYVDIVEYRMHEQNGQPILYLRSRSGVKLSLNLRIYPVESLFAAMEFRERTGAWPVRSGRSGR